jgi:hypothetical protein
MLVGMEGTPLSMARLLQVALVELLAVPVAALAMMAELPEAVVALVALLEAMFSSKWSIRF